MTMYIHTLIYAYTHMYICTHTCKCIYMYICTYTCKYIYIYICKCIYIYIHICIYIYVHTHVNIYIYIYIYVFMFTYIYLYVCIYTSLCFLYIYHSQRFGQGGCAKRLVSRIDKIVVLFCKRAKWKRLYSAKETYNLIDPANCSHPILKHWARRLCQKIGI